MGKSLTTTPWAARWNKDSHRSYWDTSRWLVILLGYSEQHSYMVPPNPRTLLPVFPVWLITNPFYVISAKTLEWNNVNVLGGGQLEQCLPPSLPFVSWGVLFHQVKLVETILLAPAVPSPVPGQHSNQGNCHAHSFCPEGIEHMLSGLEASVQRHEPGGRAVISLEPYALYCCSCQCMVGTKQVFWSWQIWMFQQALNSRCAASKVLAPHPVTEVQCIWWSISVCPSLQRAGEKNPFLLLRKLWTSGIMTCWAS